jgi:hypothetical protein
MKDLRFNFEEGKQRVITMLEEQTVDFNKDMLQDIKGVINEEREDATEVIEEIIESIRLHTRFNEKAIDKVKQASTVAEVLKAMYMTVYEEMEETVLTELFGLESVTKED